MLINKITNAVNGIKKSRLKLKCIRVVTHDRIDIASMPPAPNNDDWYRKEKSRLDQEEKNTK